MLFSTNWELRVIIHTFSMHPPLSTSLKTTFGISYNLVFVIVFKLLTTRMFLRLNRLRYQSFKKADISMRYQIMHISYLII